MTIFELRELIGIAIGEAFMCWSETPSGVFDSDRASKIAGRLLSVYQAAEDEIKSLNFCLENKSKEIGRSEHRGNTVDYIYDKLENYSRQLVELGPKYTTLEQTNKELVAALKVIEATNTSFVQIADVVETIKQIAHEALAKVTDSQTGGQNGKD